MKTKCASQAISLFKTVFVALGLLALGTSSAHAIAYGAQVVSGQNPSAPFYWIPNGGSAYLSSTGKSGAPGVPSRYGCYYRTSLVVGQGYGIVNTNGTATGDGVVYYQVEVTFPSSNVSGDILMAVTSTNCDIGFGGADATNGTAAACSAFQSANSAGKWATVCYLTNWTGVTQPHVAFTFVSGTMSGTARSYADVIRFTRKDVPCLNTGPVGVVGPISTNQTTVTVSGVDATATSVKVYQKVGGTITVIGTKTSGITAGNNAVTVTWNSSSLGAQVAATQIINGQEGCTDTIWPSYLVGGGPNPKIRISLNMRTSPNGLNTGPVGAASDTTGSPGLFFMPGSTSSTAPANSGTQITPSTNWQTIIIDPRTAVKGEIWSGTGAGGVPGTAANISQWAGLESFIWQLVDTTDCGPFDFYVDNIYSGQTLMTAFDSEASGATQFFLHPGYSGFPTGQLEGPESSVVSSSYSCSSSNAMRIKFQWAGLDSSLWLRHLVNGGSFSYPQISMTQPFQFDVLLLPKGQSLAHAVGSAPPLVDQTVCPGNSFSTAITVTAPGSPPAARTYSYQWKHNGTAMSGATTSSYGKNPVSVSDAGTYTAVVTDETGNQLSRSMVLTVPPPVTFDTQPFDAGPLAIGQAAVLSASAYISNSCPCGSVPALAYQWYHNGTPIAGATSTTYSLEAQGVTLADAGSYWLVATNLCNGQSGSSTTAKIYVYDPTWTQTYANCGYSSGLLGLYWTNQTSANAFTGPPTWTNYDGTINFNWIGEGPFPDPPFASSQSTNYFTIRWVGQVQPYWNVSQNYTFYTKTDDGARLWVDGQLLVDHWVNQGATEWSGTIALGTSPVDVVFEYFETTSSASAVLSWDSPSVGKGPIPQQQMCAANPDTEIPPLTKLTAPANNASVAFGAVVTLTANITQQSAPVNKVEFYNGATLVGTVTQTGSGSYSTTWTPPAAGVYNITARTYYSTTHVLNTPANKLTVNAPPMSAVTLKTGAGNWETSSTTVSYTGGAGTQFVLVESSDATVPIGSWTRIATNSTTPGSFNIPAVGSAAPKFYRVKSE
jgi:hypothetical protein